jgi:hypothetical protein
MLQTYIQLYPLKYEAFNALDPSAQVTLQQVFVPCNYNALLSAPRGRSLYVAMRSIT